MHSIEEIRKVFLLTLENQRKFLLIEKIFNDFYDECLDDLTQPDSKGIPSWVIDELNSWNRISTLHYCKFYKEKICKVCQDHRLGWEKTETVMTILFGKSLILETEDV